jgi:hypothetical protein
LYGAKDPPVIEFTFSRVEVHTWETDVDALPDAARHGQVSTFSWDTADGFDVITYTLHLSFVSARMEARLLAAVPSDLG